MSPAIQVVLRGPPAICRDGVPWDLGPPRGAAVVRLLAAQSELAWDREAVAERLWDGGRAREKRQRLNTTLYRLRPVWPGCPVAESRGRLRWESRAAVSVDVQEFRQRRAEQAREVTAERRRACLGRALALWRGRCVSRRGAPVGASGFMEWVHQQLRHWEQRVLEAWEPRFS